jgi:PadR family transcriptional regulator, regulatory protein PadR
MASRRTNPEFMTGVPELLILSLLAERAMYGYELVRAIEAATGAAIQLGEGVVYPALHALEHQGRLKARRESVNGRTRVYYSTTAAGRRRLADMIGEWQRVTGAIASALKGTAHEPEPSTV